MRGMNCKRAAEFLPLYAAGDLDAVREKEVASHIIVCEGCRRVADEFRESRALLVEAFETPEFGAEFYSGIRSSVLEKISREREPSTPSLVAALFGRRLAYATTLAVALIAIALAFQHFRNVRRETTRELVQQTPQTDYSSERAQHGVVVSSPQPSDAKSMTTPPRPEVVTSPHKESARRTTPNRRREPMPTPVMRDDERTLIAQVTPSSVNVVHEASESASPANGVVSPSAATAAPQFSRIEIQTADPSIRIIWLAPQKSEAPSPNEPKNENGERK